MVQNILHWNSGRNFYVRWSAIYYDLLKWWIWGKNVSSANFTYMMNVDIVLFSKFNKKANTSSGVSRIITWDFKVPVLLLVWWSLTPFNALSKSSSLDLFAEKKVACNKWSVESISDLFLCAHPSFLCRSI